MIGKKIDYKIQSFSWVQMSRVAELTSSTVKRPTIGGDRPYYLSSLDPRPFETRGPGFGRRRIRLGRRATGFDVS